MPKCRFCNKDNPPGTDRCRNCGSWLEQAVPKALAGQEPKTDAVERAAQQPDDLEGRILLLLQADRKIEAIKVYREETGSGLKEAKDAVEALAVGHPLARASGESAGIAGVDPNSLEGQVLALMQAQKTIWAVKLYRERTGVGLKEALDAVNALAAKHGISPKQAGCAGMVLLLVVVSAIISGGVWVVFG